MKTFLRACAYIGVALILSGLVLGLVGMLLGARIGDLNQNITANTHISWNNGRFRFGKALGAEDVTYTLENAEALKNLEIRLGTADIELVQGGDTYQIIGTNIYKDSLRAYIEDGDTVVIENNRLNGINVGSLEQKIVIVIPNNVSYQEIDLNIGAGAFTSDVPLIAQEADVKLGAGSIDNLNLTSQDTTIEIGMGSFNGTGSLSGKSSLKVGMGDLYFAGGMTGNVETDCSMGELTLDIMGKESDYGYEAKVGMGQFIFNGQTVTEGAGKASNRTDSNNYLECEVGMGTLTVLFDQ